MGVQSEYLGLFPKIPQVLKASWKSLKWALPLSSKKALSFLILPGMDGVILEATDGTADGKQKPIRISRDETIHLQNPYVFCVGQLHRNNSKRKQQSPGHEAPLAMRLTGWSEQKS